jgi:hypothetical protein
MKINLNNPDDFTIDNVRRMIASASDETHVQVRVTKDGIAYISTTIGSEDTEDLAFRFETLSARSDQVGDAAAQDDKWVRRIYDALKKNWPSPTGEYIDEF